MVHNYIKLPVHGHLDHFTYISIAAYICWKRSFTFLDPEGFAHKYKTPGIPDLYVKYKRKKKDQFGTRSYDQYACIEIETHATKESIEKKTEQFVNAAMNVELVVIPMNKYPRWLERQIQSGAKYTSELESLNEFIGAYIPENEISR